MAATLYVNDPVDVYTTLDTFPNRYVNLTGTITTNGIWVLGSGTLFISEIGGGTDQIGTGTEVLGRSWLFNLDAATPEVRRIVEVIDDTHLVLEKPFTNNIVAAGVPHWVTPSRAMQGSVVAIAAGGKVNGITLVANENLGWGLTGSSDPVHGDPYCLDGTGGALHTQAFYFH